MLSRRGSIRRVIQQVFPRWRLRKHCLVSYFSSECPYTVLGVPIGCHEPEQLREAYLRAVKRTHPDNNNNSSDAGESSSMAESFIRVQRALEMIQENIHRSDSDTRKDVDAYTVFHGDAGGSMTLEDNSIDNIDFRTQKEVASEFHRMVNRSDGKIPRGGAWDMARYIAERVGSKEDRPGVLESGMSASSLRRRKRR